MPRDPPTNRIRIKRQNQPLVAIAEARRKKNFVRAGRVPVCLDRQLAGHGRIWGEPD